MSKTPKEWVKILIKELYKHAQRDSCYECRRILRAMGLNPNGDEISVWEAQESGA